MPQIVEAPSHAASGDVPLVHDRGPRAARVARRSAGRRLIAFVEPPNAVTLGAMSSRDLHHRRVLAGPEPDEPAPDKPHPEQPGPREPPKPPEELPPPNEPEPIRPPDEPDPIRPPDEPDPIGPPSEPDPIRFPEDPEPNRPPPEIVPPNPQPGGPYGLGVDPATRG